MRDFLHGNGADSGIKIKDARIMFRFMERYDIKTALMISLNTETVFENSKRKVEVIPFWKYWSIKKKCM